MQIKDKLDSIIEFFQKEKKAYTATCLEGLRCPIDIAVIDHTTSETSISYLFFMKKSKFSFQEAMMILTMRHMMFQEEWNDLETYNEEDVTRWIGFLKRNYKQSEYNKHAFDFQYEEEKRLFDDFYVKNITLNGKIIDLQALEAANPLKKENIIQSTCSSFVSLTDEFYIETEQHYVLFHWFTTA